MRKMPFPFVAPVRGVSYHQDVVSGMEVGTQLEVVAEPENEFDANACAVHVNGELIGHLPRELACRLRSSGDLCWSAEVVEVLKGSKATGLRIRLLAPLIEDAALSTTCSHSSSVSKLTETTDDGAPAATQVFARSGRRLGTLVEQSEGSVQVRTDDNRIVAYPESLVLLDV